MSLIRCALAKWWGILITVLTGAYTLAVTLIVTEQYTPQQFVWILVISSALFLGFTLFVTALFVKFGILSCKG